MAGPPVTSGLNIWLDASQLGLADGATVSAWPNLGPGPATTILASAPSLTFKAGVLNGKGVVRFNASGARVRFTGTGVNNVYTVFYLARMWGTNAQRVVSSQYPEGGNLLLGYWNNRMDVGYAGTFFTPTVDIPVNTSWRLYSAWQSLTPEVRLYSDGVFICGQGSAGAVTEGFGGTFNLSGFNNNSGPADEGSDCDIAEVLFYDRQLTDAERISVEDYLRVKWLTAVVVTAGFGSMMHFWQGGAGHIPYVPADTSGNVYLRRLSMPLGMGV